MAQWTEPVFDRTQADVDYAKQQIANKVNNTYYKGCCNVTDITRIERNTDYLKEVLTSYYYITNTETRANWYDNTIPNQSHIDRIINNVDKIWKAYHKPSNAVTLPSTLLNFEQLNAIEKNHYLIKIMLDNMVTSFKRCGTFNCGEE